MGQVVPNEGTFWLDFRDFRSVMDTRTAAGIGSSRPKHASWSILLSKIISLDPHRQTDSETEYILSKDGAQ
jgi:hypothetical protein